MKSLSIIREKRGYWAAHPERDAISLIRWKQTTWLDRARRYYSYNNTPMGPTTCESRAPGTHKLHCGRSSHDRKWRCPHFHASIQGEFHRRSPPRFPSSSPWEFFLLFTSEGKAGAIMTGVKRACRPSWPPSASFWGQRSLLTGGHDSLGDPWDWGGEPRGAHPIAGHDSRPLSATICSGDLEI